MSKRNEPWFWIDTRCPECGHCSGYIYKPDLINGPIDLVCGSSSNPMRRNWPCSARWSLAITEKERENIRTHLRLAKERDDLLKRAKEIRKILYKE